jgi:hypothetical protein
MIRVDLIHAWYFIVSHAFTNLFSELYLSMFIPMPARITEKMTMILLVIALALLGLGWNFGLISGAAQIVGLRAILSFAGGLLSLVLIPVLLSALGDQSSKVRGKTKDQFD